MTEKELLEFYWGKIEYTKKKVLKEYMEANSITDKAEGMKKWAESKQKKS